METANGLKQERRRFNKDVFIYPYKRRDNEIQSPCRWLKRCFEVRCPAFASAAGNFYGGSKEVA
jgi:hypothetical protein